MKERRLEKQASDSGDFITFSRGCSTTCWCEYIVHGCDAAENIQDDDKSDETSHCDEMCVPVCSARNGMLPKSRKRNKVMTLEMWSVPIWNGENREKGSNLQSSARPAVPTLSLSITAHFTSLSYPERWLPKRRLGMWFFLNMLDCWE